MMTSLTCLLFLETLVLTANQHAIATDSPSPTRLEITNFELRSYPSMFNNCLAPFPIRSLTECVRHCANFPGPATCISVNFLPNGNDDTVISLSGSCQTCVAITSYSLVPNTPPKLRSYTAITNTGFPTSDHPFVYLDPSVYDGLALTFRIPSDVKTFNIKFLTEARWTGVQPKNGDCNLGLHADRDRNRVQLDNFRAGSGYWQHDRVMHRMSDYFAPGTESDLVIVVLESTYYFYVDGKAMGSYPRPTHLPLERITHLKLTPSIKRVAWVGRMA